MTPNIKHRKQKPKQLSTNKTTHQSLDTEEQSAQVDPYHGGRLGHGVQRHRDELHAPLTTADVERAGEGRQRHLAQVDPPAQRAAPLAVRQLQVVAQQAGHQELDAEVRRDDRQRKSQVLWATVSGNFPTTEWYNLTRKRWLQFWYWEIQYA